ncbi:MAG: NADH-quinone oxidoreductase subunit N [Phycisphaeraceae bacterium JB051]
MSELYIKIMEIRPEIIMLIGACCCLMVGLHRSAEIRKLTVAVAVLTLVFAGFYNAWQTLDSGNPWTLATFTKMAVCVVGILLLSFASGLPDKLKMSRDAESHPENFDPGNVMRGEFYAFFLFSLTGVMLCGGANDLVWLFLALELTSLPTYVMVATGRDSIKANESGIKYFFLGALSAAMFLYGFALIYGATGVTNFDQIRECIAVTGVTPLFTLGIVLSIVGIGFKIAAFPMHFYTADVYEGAPTPVTAFLAFVPKTAGFVSLILVLTLTSKTNFRMNNPEELQVYISLPNTVQAVLWVMAALTMTIGNVMGLMQTNVKRILAYSSVAHSGYMIVGLLGISSCVAGVTSTNGAAGVMFYLIAYALGNMAAFAVLACLERNGDEATDLDDLAGLSSRKPILAALMLLANLSLIGLPPMVGFAGKIYMFSAAVNAGFVGLVIIAVINSAISAVYYLRIVNACYFKQADTPQNELVPTRNRVMVALAGAVLAVYLGLAGNELANITNQATVANLFNGKIVRQVLQENPQALGSEQTAWNIEKTNP